MRLVAWCAKRGIDRLRNIRERVGERLIGELRILRRQLVAGVSNISESCFDEMAIDHAAELLIEAQRSVGKLEDFSARPAENVRDVDERNRTAERQNLLRFEIGRASCREGVW